LGAGSLGVRSVFVIAGVRKPAHNRNSCNAEICASFNQLVGGPEAGSSEVGKADAPIQANPRAPSNGRTGPPIAAGTVSVYESAA
jgi:hypothetical protein